MKNALYISILALFLSVSANADNKLRLGQNYPNPASERTFIEVVFDSPTAVLGVYNVLGEKLLHKELNHSGTFAIDVTNLPEGVYIYTLETDGQKVTKRMTVKK